MDAREDVKRNVKWIIILSVITSVVYVSMLGWRIGVTEDYNEVLDKAASQEGNSDLVDSFFYGVYKSVNSYTANFAVAMVIAVLLPICGIFGAKTKDKFLLQMFCLCNGCMACSSFAFLMNFALIGNICTDKFAENVDCSLLSSTFWISIFVFAILFILYSMSTYMASRLYNNPNLYITQVETNTVTIIKEVPVQAQPAQPVQPNVVVHIHQSPNENVVDTVKSAYPALPQV